MKYLLVVWMCCISCSHPKPYVRGWNNDNLTCSKYDNGGFDSTQIDFHNDFCRNGRGFLIGIINKYG